MIRKDAMGKLITKGYVDKALADMHKELADLKRSQQEMLSVLDLLDKKILRNKTVIERTGRELSTQLKMQLDPELYGHVLRQWYMHETGEPLDLENPEGYNAKTQWMKLYDPQSELKTKLADKLQVREFVRERISEKYLIPVLKEYKSAGEIDFDELPDRFVLKANHGCGYNAVVTDKSSEDLEALKKKASYWLKEDYALKNGYEMHYRDIPRRLFAEEYIGNGKDSIPDIKFWCFDGRVYYICVILERSVEAKMAFFDRNWERQPFVYNFPDTEKEIPKPQRLDEMIEAAEKLAKGFPHVRVDLYELEDGSIRFGEMTFTSATGTCRWDPPETDLMMGALFKLPEAADQE